MKLKMTEIKQLDNEQALAKVSTLKRELFELKFSKHTGVVEKPHTIKIVKKNIARLLTHINAK